MKSSDVVIKVTEGPCTNYISSLYKTFGGKASSNSYYLNTANSLILIHSVELFPEMELMLSDARHNKSVLINRIADNDPDYIHITFFKQGQIPQNHPNRKQYIEADTLSGAFMHNGLFPLQSHIPAGMHVKTVTYKTTRSALINLLPEAESLFTQLFGSNEPIAYHLPISIEVERLTDDIFYFNELEMGRIALIKARAIEAVASFVFKVHDLFQEGELKGLHRDDYHKLMNVKTKLLSSFNQKVTIKDLADEFGLSMSKLKRDFKTLFNCSIYQFYTHAKMDEAYRLLKMGNQSVMQIGYQLGYTNISKFTEMFKKVKGILPTEVSRLNIL